LSYWDKQAEAFTPRSPDAEAQILQRNAFEYWLLARIGGQPFLLHRISPSMNQRLSLRMLSLTWNHRDEPAGDVSTWFLRFEDADAYEEYNGWFSKAMFETTNEMAWEKIKVNHSSRRLSNNTIYRHFSPTSNSISSTRITKTRKC
jgi:hypothetical protein